MRAGRSARRPSRDRARPRRIEEVMGPTEVADIVARLERAGSRRQPLSGAARTAEAAVSGPVRAPPARPATNPSTSPPVCPPRSPTRWPSPRRSHRRRRDRLRGVGRLDAEAHDHRQVGRRLDPRDLGGHVARLRLRRAGDPGDRDVVDEARRVLQDRRQALVVGRGRGQPDEVQPGRLRGDAQLLVFLGRQVDDDQPVDPGRLGVARNRSTPRE
jgi:hypothetical protein